MLFIRKSALAALALTLALVLPASAAPVPAEGAAGSYEKYLPDDADGVITINVRALLDSELMKKFGLDKMLAGNDDAQKAFKALGLDPLKDIERVVISGDNDKSSDQAFVIIQGKFDTAKLSAAAEAAAKDDKGVLKIHKTDHGKIYEVSKLDEIIKLPPQAAGAGVNFKGKSVVFVVLADKGNVVAVPTKEGAEEVLAKAAGKKTTKLKSKELAALIAKIDPKQTVAIAMPGPAGEDKIKSVTGGITVTADVKVRFTVTAADADAAKDLNEKLKEQLGMIQAIAGAVALQQKELAPAIDILNGIEHEAKDNTIGIKSDIKGETLEKLVKAVAELAAKTGGIK